MRGQIFTADHKVYQLPELFSWRLLYTGSVPCDCFEVTFPYDASMAGPLHLAAGFAAWEGGELRLQGIVDQYTVTMGAEGISAVIRGRGYAARLLDNESRPVTYQSVTLRELIRQHVTPYGISAGEIADVTSSSVYTVAAGMSQWKALEGFCLTYGGFSPRFGRDGKLLAAPEGKLGPYLMIRDDTPILSASLEEDHYGVLTEVLVIDKKQNVSYSVKNPDMIRRGGQCRRVVYTPGQSTWAAMRYTGEYQVQRSREQEFALRLQLPGNFAAFPGDRVQVQLTRLGLFGTYRVAQAEDLGSAREGRTETLTLKELK